MNLIRQVVETNQPDYIKFLFQGEIIDDDYVCPETVKVYTLWKNYKGQQRIGPEITSPTSSGQEDKLRLRAAVSLTKLFKETQDGGSTKRQRNSG